MVKARPRRPKRKTPITDAGATSGSIVGPSGSSSKPAATRKVIRRFHVLNKRQLQLRKTLGNQKKSGLSDEARQAKEELTAIEQEIEEMGGLEAYQKMSVIGQGNDRGGGSEKVLIGFLDDLGYPMHLEKEKWRCIFPYPLLHG
jgi:25S rRNA (adenine2142-N1)-methyltransferase